MNNELGQTIDDVANAATHSFESALRRNFLRSQLAVAIALLPVVPMLAVGFQLNRWWMRLPAGFGFSWPWLIALAVALPIAWLLIRSFLYHVQISRQRALGKIDAQLGSSERLVTADQFLKQPLPDAFRQAAVEDAEQWAERAIQESLHANRQQEFSFGKSILAIPLTIIALWGCSWLARQSRIADAVKNSPLAAASAIDAVANKRSQQVTPPTPTNVDAKEKPPPSPRPSDRQPERRTNRKGTASSVMPDDAEQSRGRLTDGETSESQQSSNPSSARGEPSSSGQPSTSDTQSPRKPKKEPKQRDDKDRPNRKQKEQEEPSGSTAGQGSSKGSNNNAAPSDWSSKSQAATPDNEDIEDEEDVDDEDEEQESRGGVQPNMRDRRTPVNRDLQIGFGNNRPNPDANGRGGPGGQKKSRGVASLVLGVPIPDRITGQPNKGRIRITQQRITPEAEQSESVAAENRGARNSETQRIHHHEFTPWLQNFVRQYFLDRRSAFPLNPDGLDQTQTSSSVESDNNPS